MEGLIRRAAGPRFWGLMALGLLAVGAVVRGISDESVFLEVELSPGGLPQVMFRWDEQAPGGVMAVARRPLGAEGAASFVARGEVLHPERTFTDSLEPGMLYEYRLRRPALTVGLNTYRENGTYVVVGQEGELVESHGGVLLVVDHLTASVLRPELELLELDLAADGWKVVRMDFPRHPEGSPTALRQAVADAVAADPSLTALYLFGHLPIARSGSLAPDGHESVPHATDAFYAVFAGGEWTDTASTSGRIPGDGVFDQNEMPGRALLMVGRVDLSGMPRYRKGEVEMLRDYIHKTHAWRLGHRAVPRRALWNSSHLWTERNWIRPMFGLASFLGSEFQPRLSSNPYLLGADFGYFDGADAIYTTAAYQLIFGINFGSHKQKWDRPNNEMRALLTQPDYGLGCVWGGRPAWYLHQMQGGRPIGHSVLRMMGNSFSGPTTASRNGWEYFPLGTYSYMGSWVHINLMGDPTLRLDPAPPPTEVAVERNGPEAVLTWTPPSGPDYRGCLVYRSGSRRGPFVRLNPDPLQSGRWVDPAPPPGEVLYLVRSLSLQTTPTATYINPSAGRAAALRADGSPNRPPQALAESLEVQSNMPWPLRLAGTDPEGDDLLPVILENPTRGQLRWRDGQAYYVSHGNYTGADRLVFAVFDGVALSAPVLVPITVAAEANTLLAWDFPEPETQGPQNKTASWVHPQLSASDLELGSGVSERTLPRNTRDGLTIAGLHSAQLDPNDYIGWRIAPRSGQRMTVQHLVVALHAEEARTLQVCLRFSLDGFSTFEEVALTPTGTFTGRGDALNAGLPHHAELSGFPQLRATKRTVEFRIHFWGAPAATTTAGIGKLSDAVDEVPLVVDRISDLVLAGTTLPALPADYASWQHHHFSPEEIENPSQSGFGADFSGDGFCNGLNFALGLDPRSRHRASEGLALSLAGEEIHLTWRQRSGGTGTPSTGYTALGATSTLVHRPLSGDPNAPWQPLAVETVGAAQAQDDGVESITVRISPHTAPPLPFLVRLEVEPSEAGP